MARKPRIWFPGATYHITSRGNRKSTLFYNDKDRITYFKILEDTRLKYPFHLHSYCLMTNHIHLLMETINDNPKDIMKMLHANYAIYLNKRYDLEGHVFQGRYRADLIDSLNYFLTVSRYIHLNPVEAQLVTKPEEYPWSSCRTYLLNKRNRHITTAKTLSYFPEPRRINYRKFIENI